MSGMKVTLVPACPRLIPNARVRRTIVERVREIAGSEAELRELVEDSPQFYSAMANLESIACPRCGRLVSEDWWGNEMSQDYADGGFSLAQLCLPCCGGKATLNDLTYHFDQAFGCYGLEVREPGREFVVRAANELREILGMDVRVVQSHI